MENMQYAEDLVRESLLFRGFTNTLLAFEAELGTDVGKEFQVDKLLELIFSMYIPGFQADNLVGLLNFFKQLFSPSTSETVLVATLSKLEISILRCYIVHAIRSGKRDKVIDLFNMFGNDLLQKGQEWTPWFAIPYAKNPSSDPEFCIYFTKAWYEALQLSVRNFFNEIFNYSFIPALLKISIEKNNVNRLKKEVKQLNVKLAELQVLLEEKDTQLSLSRSHAKSTIDSSRRQSESSTLSVGVPEEHNLKMRDVQGRVAKTPLVGSAELVQDWLVTGKSKEVLECSTSKSIHESSLISSYTGDGHGDGSSEVVYDSLHDKNRREMREEEFPEVKVDFQETFLGHTSPITQRCLSASGNNIASASVDGTVRIWTYDSSTSPSRNATIYCGADIMSLDWECKSYRLELLAAALKHGMLMRRGLFVISAQPKRAKDVMDIKCSSVEPIYVSASASGWPSLGYIDNLGLASLTVWNMRIWKAMTVLPLDEDPPAITSLCFNHNGKILAASTTDAMIHMFGWPAHDSPKVLFFLGLMRQVFIVWVQMERFLNGACRTMAKSSDLMMMRRLAGLLRYGMALDASLHSDTETG